MDTRSKEILKLSQQNQLGLDDTFKFKCRHCGKCCRNREDILLTARDLYNISKKLNLTIENFTAEYCEIYLGHDSRIPVVRLKSQGSGHVCPLLQGNLCIVHDSKPTVCALYPLGRSVAIEKENGENILPEDIQVRYFLQPAPCGSQARSHTVQSWLEKFGISAEDEFFSLWTATIMPLINFFHKFEKEIPDKTKEIPDKTQDLFEGIVFSMLYCNYDTDKEFLPQFVTNATNLKAIFTNIEANSERFFGGAKNGE